MENKYYTPEINEFYVGYKYEVYNSLLGRWIKEEVQSNECFCDLQGEEIRTKYLDKQDIESLGWVYAEAFKSYFKNKVRLELCSEGTVRISFGEFNTMDFKCPSINELKYIQKLLGIK